MHASVRNMLIPFLKHYEGEINFMYLDVKGFVTIGIGNLIDPVDKALTLPFRHKDRRTLVSKEEIKAEWLQVKSK